MRNVPGIYTIRFSGCDGVYVGSAIRLADRRSQHLCDLRKGRHNNAKLQNAWNKYGEGAFKFEVIELLQNASELIGREQHWIDALGSHYTSGGFNLSPTAGSSLGHTHSPQTRALISSIVRGFRHSDESKARISQSIKGKPKSQQQIDKHAAAVAKNWRVWNPQGEVCEIRNLAKFCRENGLQRSAMLQVANGRSKHHRGWRCENTERPFPEGYWQPKPNTFRVFMPDGSSLDIRSLNQFCAAMGLSAGGLHSTLPDSTRKRKAYKGYRLERII